MPEAALHRLGSNVPQLLHQVSGFLHVDEAPGDDVRAGEDAAVLAGKVHHHHDHTVLGQMLPVPKDHAAHVPYAQAVHQHLPGGNGARKLCRIPGELDDPADVADDDMVGIHAHLTGKLRMALEVTLLSVDGNEELGLHQGVDDFQLLLAGVARHMEVRQLVIDHLRALPIELVDDGGNGLFVAGNGRGGDQHPVAGLDLHLTVAGEGHAVQGRHVFALGAGGDDHLLVLGNGLDGVDIHQGVFWDVHVSQLCGNPHHVLHAPSGDGNLPAVLGGKVDDGLDPVHVGGEGGDDDPPVAAADETVQALCHLDLRGGISLPLHVGGVAQQGQNALVAQGAKPGKICDPAVQRRGIDLEIAGHDHHTHRGVDGKGHSIGDGMVHMDEFHLEAACLHRLPRLMGDDGSGVQQIMLLQLDLDQAGSQTGGMQRRVHLLEHIGQTADVVLMAVSQEKATELMPVLHQVGNVGHHQVHTVHVVLREAQTAVHHDHVVSIFQDGDVFPDLVQPAQGNDFQFFSQR